MDFTRDGLCPTNGVYTSDGKLFVGNYPGRRWFDDDVKPYHDQIKEIRKDDPINKKSSSKSWKRGKVSKNNPSNLSRRGRSRNFRLGLQNWKRDQRLMLTMMTLLVVKTMMREDPSEEGILRKRDCLS